MNNCVVMLLYYTIYYIVSYLNCEWRSEYLKTGELCDKYNIAAVVTCVPRVMTHGVHNIITIV